MTMKERIARIIARDPANFPYEWEDIEPEDQIIMLRQAEAVLTEIEGEKCNECGGSGQRIIPKHCGACEEEIEDCPKCKKEETHDTKNI